MPTDMVHYLWCIGASQNNPYGFMRIGETWNMNLTMYSVVFNEMQNNSLLKHLALQMTGVAVRSLVTTL